MRRRRTDLVDGDRRLVGMALADPVERIEIDTVRDRAGGKIQDLAQPNAAGL